VTSSPGASPAKPLGWAPTVSPSAFAWLFRSPWRWAFGALLLAAMLGLFMMIRAQRQAVAAQQAEAFARHLRQKFPVIPSLSLTVVSVDFREDAKGHWLGIDVVERPDGDCDLTIRTEGLEGAVPVETRKSSFRKEVPGQAPVEHLRIEWLLPKAMDQAGRIALHQGVNTSLLHKSFTLRPGDERRVFSVSRAANGPLSAYLGVRLPDPAPDAKRP
jgi:hypothetical protein